MNIEKLKDFIDRVKEKKDKTQTEEATKTALVLPFLQLLGYNIFNPEEVIPEFIADVGTKKDEKVDYAIKVNNALSIIIECKDSSTILSSKHTNQLYRYFTVTEAKIAVLTNGVEYQFYSDLVDANKMDSLPFFSINLLDCSDNQLQQLLFISNSNMSAGNLAQVTENLRLNHELLKHIQELFVSPNDEFCKMLLKLVWGNKPITSKVLNENTSEIKKALNQFLKSKIMDAVQHGIAYQADEDIDENEIVTTQDELDGYHIVKAILSSVLEPSRIVNRDVVSYFGILLDDNNRKPLARLYFNTSQKYLALFDNPERKEDKIPINDVADIYQYQDRLKNTISFYQ